jgi:hypothetical protein
MLYKITLDLSHNIFDNLPTIEARSPKEAAEIYAQEPITRHMGKLGGDIVVEKTTFPRASFLYDRKK